MDSKVDALLAKTTRWRDEFAALRAIALECKLTEDVKWGQPCYTLDGANVVLIHGFKEYCALLFFKGALMKDAKGVLIKQTENVQAARQIRFTAVADIVKMKATLMAYVRDAMELEKAGLKVAFKKAEEFAVPAEFQIKLDENPALNTAFAALTPGRQRAYLLHFGSAKQAKTRTARVEKELDRILSGKGLDD